MGDEVMLFVPTSKSHHSTGLCSKF